MKDVQGIQRGKCNSCECEEYRTPSSDSPNKYRCEYCNHTPVDHVRIIKLGKCKCGDCEEYDSEDPNSYTDCQYCGCAGSDHAGAEKLRKTAPPTGAQPGIMSLAGGPVVVQQQGGFQPRMDAHGRPVQSPMFGTCKNPGCSFPRRVEGGKVHDFCSRTCANKFSEVPSTRAPLTTTPLSTGGLPHPHAAMPGAPDAGGMNQPPGCVGGPGGKLCTQCKVKPANPGRSWCQQCYVTKGSKS